MREWNRRRKEADPEAERLRQKVKYQKRIDSAEKLAAVREEKRIWAKARYHKTPEVFVERSKEYGRKNPDKRRVTYQNWKLANPGRAYASTKAWCERNPEWKAERRATEKRAVPIWLTFEQRAEIKSVYLAGRQAGLCVDHIVPLKSSRVCGLHVGWNLQLLTRADNTAKLNRHWPDDAYQEAA